MGFSKNTGNPPFTTIHLVTFFSVFWLFSELWTIIKSAVVSQGLLVFTTVDMYQVIPTCDHPWQGKSMGKLDWLNNPVVHLATIANLSSTRAKQLSCLAMAILGLVVVASWGRPVVICECVLLIATVSTEGKSKKSKWQLQPSHWSLVHTTHVEQRQGIGGMAVSAILTFLTLLGLSPTVLPWRNLTELHRTICSPLSPPQQSRPFLLFPLHLFHYLFAVAAPDGV